MKSHTSESLHLNIEAKTSYVSVSSRITEEIRRRGSFEHPGYGAPRKIVDAATREVLRTLTSAPVSPNDAQALFLYTFERLGWL